MEGLHKPVLADQAIHYLGCSSGGDYCDGTIGLGGHAEGILKTSSPNGRLIGIDLDSSALAIAKDRLAKYGERVTLIQGNYRDLPAILESNSFSAVDGVLLDLGLSSYQLQDKKRGFSFLYDSPLLMNFEINGRADASKIINQYSESDLADIIWEYGQERWSRRIAHRIVKERANNPIETTSQLLRVVYSAIPHSNRRSRINPATKTFQALRIEVNHELENLAEFLKVVWGCLKHGGRICIISFHSLEDRLVKRCFRDLSLGKEKRVKILTKKPIRPDPEEIMANSRSRSARMRVAEWL